MRGERCICEQYLSIILPGKTFAGHFERFGLARKNLSHVFEDAGTVVNLLVPCISGILQVPTVQYAPFVFFCLLCLALAILTDFTNIGITRITKKEHATM
ncbi:Na+/H+ antiporter NhaC family protein [Ectobacillus antri]|jgi:NhaC family Na+:H+ antiporter|uniref:Na+/H+ antiporter NhaC family protein n=1 Tax=Ectobacillus antri TaxID=2486280 RepID=A0ABT6H4Q5_9BACI|nr:Na+/H+ antiporter NhaC family protein [Ectobacillus antri]MDG4655658.1 Na+/H+ antiporter NhaC family protein [Ectobacillus antri]MDG5753416.1 Na+/H+ antiporter NhaC family protein [Ectobacillus antri]